MTVTYGYDVTAANYDYRLNQGQIALYITGGSSIAATPQMLAANPAAVRIDQSPVITGIDVTADAFDFENGAITLAELPQVIKLAWQSYNNKARPGQRKPVVYASEDNLTPVANALDNAGIGNLGTGLWVAKWPTTPQQAAGAVNGASGPFPIRAFQYTDDPYYDLDVFSTEWLNDVSTPVIPPEPPVAYPTAKTPPGQWNNPDEWAWQDAVIAGRGLNGKLYIYALDPATGEWTKGIA